MVLSYSTFPRIRFGLCTLVIIVVYWLIHANDSISANDSFDFSMDSWFICIPPYITSKNPWSSAYFSPNTASDSVSHMERHTLSLNTTSSCTASSLIKDYQFSSFSLSSTHKEDDFTEEIIRCCPSLLPFVSNREMIRLPSWIARKKCIKSVLNRKRTDPFAAGLEIYPMLNADLFLDYHL